MAEQIVPARLNVGITIDSTGSICRLLRSNAGRLTLAVQKPVEQNLTRNAG